MILLLSINGDTTTEDVMDWLMAKKADFIRLNDEEFLLGAYSTFEINNKGCKVEFNLQKRGIDMDSINVIWYRKFGYYSATELGITTTHKQIPLKVKNHLKSEYLAFTDLFLLFDNKFWLCKPNKVEISKTYQLSAAKNKGFDIPDTIITSSKKNVLRFLNKHQCIITKPIKDGRLFQIKKAGYYLYTSLFDKSNLSEMPDDFFPSLFQEKLNKEFEVRTFFINNSCYSMAIFSQNDDRTKVDFRALNKKKPNRNVPFILPRKIELKIIALMNKLELNTGSIDFVITKDGRCVFLEVNPIGQLGMVSQPCNYYLEEIIADFLISKNQIS
jgi:ATP-GRASP peptide maturase of grasp-with-spasm system